MTTPEVIHPSRQHAVDPCDHLFERGGPGLTDDLTNPVLDSLTGRLLRGHQDEVAFSSALANPAQIKPQKAKGIPFEGVDHLRFLRIQAHAKWRETDSIGFSGKMPRH